VAGGIQKCDVMAKVTMKEHKYSVYTAILWHRWSARNSCVICAVHFWLSRDM